MILFRISTEAALFYLCYWTSARPFTLSPPQLYWMFFKTVSISKTQLYPGLLHTSLIDSKGLDWRDSYSSTFQLTQGVPQGSVLDPVLFTLYTQPMSSIMQNHNIQYHKYENFISALILLLMITFSLRRIS